MLFDLFNQMLQDSFLSSEALSAKNQECAAELGALRTAGAGLPALNPNMAGKGWRVQADGLWMEFLDGRKGVIRLVCMPGDHGSIHVDAIQFMRAPDGTLFVPEFTAAQLKQLKAIHAAGF